MKRAKETYQNRIELLPGPLAMLILPPLQWGPQHGYGVSQALRSRSSEVLQVETGSLYPALHRMERYKWIAAEWRKTDQNQRARYYRITARGLTTLNDALARVHALKPIRRARASSSR